MTDPNAPHQDDELLTSYLDGEVTEAERRSVQNRLMDDPDLRRRLSDLQQAWELLDDLPESTANQEFTKSTLELVTVGAEKGWDAVSFSGRTSSPWLRGTRLIAILFASALALGTMTGMAVRYQTERSDLQQLNVIAYLPGLRAVEDLEVIQALSEIPDIDFAASKPEIFEGKVISAMPESLASRRDWVDKLDSAQQSLLYTYRMQLEDMHPKDQEELHQLANKVSQEKDSQKYKNAMAVVAAIYNEKPSEMIALKANSDVPREKRIRQAFYRRLGEWYFQDLAKKSSEENDNELIKSWIDHQLSDSEFRFVFSSVFNLNASTSLRRNGIREKLLVYRSTEMRELAEGNYINLHGKKLSEFSQRILSEVEDSERARFLADWYLSRSRFNTEFSFEKVFESYKAFAPDVRDRLDLSTYEEIKRQAWARRLLRSGLGPNPASRSDRPSNDSTDNK